LPRDREIVVYDSDPNELASTDVAADLIRQGYRAVALQGRHRRLDGRELPDGNEGSAQSRRRLNLARLKG
jgi:hypothetical protein